MSERGWTWRSIFTAIICAGLTAGAAPAAAVELTVDTLTDPAGPGACSGGVPEDCSLRQAIELANASTGTPDEVVFKAGLSGTLALTTAAGGEISITDSVFVSGNGADRTIVRAAPSSRIFYIDMATAANDVGLDSMTLTGGSLTAPLSSSVGGAVLNADAVLTVSDSVLTDNTAIAGGAIVDGHGRSSFLNSTFSGNTGGAILAFGGFEVIAGSTFSGNSAARGSAVYVNTSPGGVIYDSTISGNFVDDGGSQTGAVEMPFPILINTVVANTFGPNARDVDHGFGAYASTSLIESVNSSTEIEGSGNIFGIDPQLGDLTANGGSTPTIRPTASSPLIDRGQSDAAIDQRGFPRVVNNPNVSDPPGGNGADIGSVELTLGEGPQAVASEPSLQPPQKRKCKKAKKRKKKSGGSATALAKKKPKKKPKKKCRGARGAQRSSS